MTTANAEPVITKQIANHILWFFSHDEGYQPGGFFEAFYELASRADKENLAKLGEGFPAQIEAFTLGRNEVGGLEMLRTIAHVLHSVSE